MTRKVDPEVLAGFVEEARSYLPAIHAGIDRFRSEPSSPEALEAAYRHVHTIKGAASMVGLSGLSHAAYRLEEALEDASAGKLPLSDDTGPLFQRSVVLLETYLNGISAGNLVEQPILNEADHIFRRLRGLPDAPEPAPPAADQPVEVPAAESTPSATNESPPISDVIGQDEKAPPLEPEVESEAATDDEVSPELLEVFALEADDHLRNITSRLPELRSRPDDKAILQEVRRSAHTLKGSAAMVGFRSITQLAHRMEDLLDLLYADERVLTPDILNLLFASTDALEDLATKRAPAYSFRHLFDQYAKLLEEGAPSPEPEAVPAPPPAVATTPAPEETPAGEPAGAGRPRGQFVRVPIARLDELVKLVSELVITRSAFEQRMAEFLHQVDELRRSTDRLRRVSYKLETEYEASALGGGPSPQSPIPGVPASGHGNRIRHLFGEAHGFDDLELDRYTEFHLLSRELAETTTDIQTITGELGHLLGDFDTYLNRQGRQSSEIEDKLMRLRMVPLATLASRLFRTVRNVANQQGKQAELVLEGENTELDKTVLEELADPLLHLLRNAVDHGIEPSELRQVRGKPPRGTVRLRAYHEGSQVVVQVADDGAGIDPEVLRASAVQRGFIPATDAAAMSVEALTSLIFLPGFSTAQEISEVSGRGVGLDIVKAHVHRLKGTLNVDAPPGRGTCFTIRLPMTLAITRALLVRASQETFAVPLDAVRQIVRAEPEDIEQLGQEPVIRVGGRVYPVVYLTRVLGLKQSSEESARRSPVLVLNTGTRDVGLVVDQLLGGREIVIKNLGNHLRQVRGVSGATLMGDGSVVLILNPLDLVSDGMQARVTRPTPVAVVRPRETLTILVVDDSPSVRRVVTNLLRSAGWQPVAAKDGLEALEILQHSATPPDLILLDIEMPRMDGYELLSTLRGQDAYRHVPVVMVTSRAGEKHRRRALDLGASGYMVKPYQDEALLSVIRQLVRTSRQAALA
jgi:chemosensory pili system protein ChpA (sensor histidine kinase/response regulator)